MGGRKEEKNSLLGKFWAIQRNGILAEIRTKDAPNNLKRKGKIKDYKQSEWLGEYDRKGIDFTILPVLSKQPIFLQVKSFLYPEQIASWQLEKKDEELRIWLNKKGIYTIEVWKNEDVGRVENKIIRILKINGEKTKNDPNTIISKSN